MNTGNGSTSAPIGVLEELVTRLAAITPDEYVVPFVKPGKDDFVVAVATDDIKKLFSLQCILANQREELTMSIARIAEECLRDVFQKGPDVADKELQTPGNPLFEANARMDNIKTESDDLRRLIEIARKMMWLEIARQHPDLASHPINGIRSDWTLCWTERGDADDGAEMGFHFLSIGMGDLDEFMRGMPAH